jgi:hypothetical protein
MRNALWYPGFLSPLSLLYFVEGKIAFLGFLGFLSYFSFYRVKDERLELNVSRATRNAFMFTMLCGCGVIIYGYLSKNMELLALSFPLLFGGSLLVCIHSVFYYGLLGH